MCLPSMPRTCGRLGYFLKSMISNGEAKLELSSTLEEDAENSISAQLLKKVRLPGAIIKNMLL